MNINDLYQSTLGFSDPAGQAWAQSVYGDDVDSSELANFLQVAQQNGSQMTYNNPSSVYSGAGTVPGMSLNNLYSSAGLTPDAEGYNFWNTKFGPTLEQHEIDAFNTSATQNKANAYNTQQQLPKITNPVTNQQTNPNTAMMENMGMATLFPRTNWGNYQTSSRGGRYFDTTTGKYQGLGNITQTASL